MTDAGASISSPDRLANAREQFLSTEEVDAESVRKTILASWWRSRTHRVAADHVKTPYVEDPNLETPLLQSAGAVLDALEDKLSDLAVSVVLTDDQALVLDRRTEDRALERYLDGVQLARGFSYAEEFVGTNGIGTALEGRQATAVFGHEHYAENLDTLACAGVPIRHPISGQVLGLLDLTCWKKDAGPLLLALAKATAHDIETELTTQVGLRELSLFSAYLRACRRGQGIVLAVNNDLVMLNDHARQLLVPEDQAALLARAVEALSSQSDRSLSMDLPSGARARLSYTPVSSDVGPAGGVVRARLLQEPEVVSARTDTRQPVLPGIVGTGALWVRACHSVGRFARDRKWTVVEGGPGSGKLAVARAAHSGSTASAPCEVVELDGIKPGEWEVPVRRALRKGPGTVVFRHLDKLSQQEQRALAAVLDDARLDARVWGVATVSEGEQDGLDTDLMRHFPTSVTVPPLRHHIEDVRVLVPFLLAQLGKGPLLHCSPAALQLLLRNEWPGNVAQLRQVLRKVVHTRRAGVIEPEDLPPECRTVVKRVLNPLESLERDAIVRSLLDADGNKSRAAHSLGMSRATIYRKIRDYGIDIPS
ncbi:helix-turn-helix domain-containing protein [Amycolatopsis sp. NPDC050768]|uniref:sigma-54-dependent Fis family transcriptional regulator n=1 Tax=Amycolatopsis sp. NPDC050768 TaxID=3154839 RepID=UPI001C6A4AC5|nr:GAF domain-containing protein [Amycolatopsis sp. DSM 110486]